MAESLRGFLCGTTALLLVVAGTGIANGVSANDQATVISTTWCEIQPTMTTSLISTMLQLLE
jgi:hypothetical protein